jgi:type II secretory pathway component GspD/PulD (secretin)
VGTLARILFAWSLLLPAVPAQEAAPPEAAIEQVITDIDLRHARDMLPPPELKLPDQLFSLDYNDTHRNLWQAVGKLLKIEVVFDSEYTGEDARVRIRTTDQTARQVLQSVSSATGSFVVALRPDKLMVAKDTTQKRQEREPNVAVVLNLPDPITIQELQESARAVQQVMEIQKFAIDNNRRMVLMRDRISKVRPAQILFEQLLGARPAVLVEVELYELRSTLTTDAGIRLPTSSRLYWLGNLLNNPAPTASGALATFGSGSSLIGMTIGDATVTATALKSYGTNVQRSFIQAMSGMPSQLLIGEKYPIVTAGYYGDTGGTAGDVFRPPPSFQFENLGLTLKVTPFVHGEDEMTLDVEAEFKLLTGAEINGLPILANRKFTSRVRMQNGQWAIMSGLQADSRRLVTSGIPGLMQLPILGPLLRTNTIEVDESSALLVLKPRLLGVPPGTMTPGEIFLGPEGRPAVPLE